MRRENIQASTEMRHIPQRLHRNLHITEFALKSNTRRIYYDNITSENALRLGLERVYFQSQYTFLIAKMYDRPFLWNAAKRYEKIFDPLTCGYYFPLKSEILNDYKMMYFVPEASPSTRTITGKLLEIGEKIPDEGPPVALPIAPWKDPETRMRFRIMEKFNFPDN